MRIKNFYTFLSFSLISYISSNYAYSDSATSGVSQPMNTSAFVKLKDDPQVFELDFTALILQPFSNLFDYAGVAFPLSYTDNLGGVVSPDWQTPTMSPSFDFGFDILASYIFCGGSQKISLAWERFHSGTSSASFPSSGDTPALFMVGPYSTLGPDASDYTYAKGKLKYHFDEAGLIYSTLLSCGKRMGINLYTGVSYSHIKQYRYQYFLNENRSLSRTFKCPSSFSGAGPKVGIDLGYNLYKGLKLVAAGSSALYVGRFKNTTTITTTSRLLELLNLNPSYQTITATQNKMGVVPGFKVKIGLDYDYRFYDKYDFKIEAGYSAEIYINSIRSVDMQSQVDTGIFVTQAAEETGVYVRSLVRTVSDFGLAGPYAKIGFAF